ncbi:unnamed protein product [Lasius platythorax]|uniref:Uncharacterized protein n=1 Tax=Lasius platythorax TaxID=488582 RepID=A0AAV2P7S3_9HYME
MLWSSVSQTCVYIYRPLVVPGCVEARILYTRLSQSNKPFYRESDSSGEHPDAHCRAFGFLISGRGKPETQG